MIDVLWIDDHCFNTDGTPTDLYVEVVDCAKEFNINITAYNTYAEALSELESNPYKWIAIILDICNESAKDGKVTDDFNLARSRIDAIRNKYNRKEPYIFVFSGSEHAEAAKSFTMPPFEGAQRKVYSKPDEAELIFEDINTIAPLSDIYQIINKFKDIFESIKNEALQFEQEDETRLQAIVYKIDYKRENRDDSILTDLRKIVEKLIRLIPFEKDENDNSINKASQFIGSNNYVPRYIQRAFHTLAVVLNEGSHNMQITNDVRSGNAPYLLKSCMYELFNIIIWLKNTLQNETLELLQQKLKENYKPKK